MRAPFTTNTASLHVWYLSQKLSKGFNDDSSKMALMIDELAPPLPPAAKLSKGDNPRSEDDPPEWVP